LGRKVKERRVDRIRGEERGIKEWKKEERAGKTKETRGRGCSR